MVEVIRYGADGAVYRGAQTAEVEDGPVDWTKVPSAELISDLADLDAEGFTEKYGVNKTTVKKGEA